MKESSQKWKKAANAIKPTKTIRKIGSWKFYTKKWLLWLTTDNKGMIYFQHNLKKMHGLCPIMSSKMLSKQSASKQTQLIVGMCYESSIHLALLLWKGHTLAKSQKHSSDSGCTPIINEFKDVNSSLKRLTICFLEWWLKERRGGWWTQEVLLCVQTKRPEE